METNPQHKDVRASESGTQAAAAAMTAPTRSTPQAQRRTYILLPTKHANGLANTAVGPPPRMVLLRTQSTPIGQSNQQLAIREQPQIAQHPPTPESQQRTLHPAAATMPRVQQSQLQSCQPQPIIVSANTATNSLHATTTPAHRAPSRGADRTQRAINKRRPATSRVSCGHLKRPQPSLLQLPISTPPCGDLTPPGDQEGPDDGGEPNDTTNIPHELQRRQDNPNSNFTTSERTFVLMALAVARDRLNLTPNWSKPREGFGTVLCQEVREILDEPAFRHVVRKSANYVNGERRSPTDNVLRDIWTSFLKNGTPARANRGGRHKNEEARTRIRELLEESQGAGGNYSSREISALTGASRSLVCAALRELKGAARKAAASARATAGTSGKIGQRPSGRAADQSGTNQEDATVPSDSSRGDQLESVQQVGAGGAGAQFVSGHGPAAY